MQAVYQDNLPVIIGFVLIAALWFVALLAFMGVIIAGWMTRSMEAAAALEDRITVRQDTIDAPPPPQAKFVWRAR